MNIFVGTATSPSMYKPILIRANQVKPSILMSLRHSWHRAPALQILIPIGLGAYLGSMPGCGISPWLLLSASSICLIVAFILLRLSQLGQWGHDWGNRLFALGIGGVLCLMMTLRVAYLPSPNSSGAEPHGSLRRELMMQIQDEPISPEVQRLLSAIALGYTERTPETKAMRQSFTYSGAAHILAVSGYHLGLIVGVGALLLGWMRRSRTGGAIYWGLLILLAWGFVALTGWGAPTQRAALMLTLYLGAKVIGRPPVPINILSASALLQLLICPEHIYSYGMWLSYVAVLSILLYGRSLYGLVGEIRRGVFSWLWGAFSVTMAAQILVLPLCLYLFGFVSWSFVLTCLPMAVLSTLLIPLGGLGYGLSAFGVELGILGKLIEWIGQGMLAVARYGEMLTPLVQRTPIPLWLLLVWWGFALLVTFLLPQANDSSVASQVPSRRRR